MSRTNINIDSGLIRKARKLTRLKTKRRIVDKALELVVRSDSRKGILRTCLATLNQQLSDWRQEDLLRAGDTRAVQSPKKLG